MIAMILEVKNAQGQQQKEDFGFVWIHWLNGSSFMILL